MKVCVPNLAALGCAALLGLAAFGSAVRADIKILTIGDPIISIDRDVVTLGSSYAPAESPSKAIDNLYERGSFAAPIFCAAWLAVMTIVMSE